MASQVLLVRFHVAPSMRIILLEGELAEKIKAVELVKDFHAYAESFNACDGMLYRHGVWR